MVLSPSMSWNTRMPTESLSISSLDRTPSASTTVSTRESAEAIRLYRRGVLVSPARRSRLEYTTNEILNRYAHPYILQ